MRKIIFITLIMILSANAFCQEKQIHFGVKLGYARSRFMPNYTDNNGTRYTYTTVGGVIAGCFIQTSISKKLLFQPEFLMVLKGTSHSGFKFNDRITYLEIPINLLVKLPAKSSFVFLGGGPVPAFSIRSSYSSYNAFDFGVNALAGIRFPLGFSMQLNFTRGVLKVYKENPKNLTNSAMGFSVGYTF